MFGKQDREVVFLETVMGLAQQRRHCLVECIPLPSEIAKQAPLYFKKVCTFVQVQKLRNIYQYSLSTNKSKKQCLYKLKY